MWEIIEWIIWIILAYCSFSFVFGCRLLTKEGRGFHLATGVQALFFFIITILFLAFDWSKFHILWITPVCFFWARDIVFPGFPIFTPVVLFFTKIFLNIALIGVKRPKTNQQEINFTSQEDPTLKVMENQKEIEKVIKVLERINQDFLSQGIIESVCSITDGVKKLIFKDCGRYISIIQEGKSVEVVVYSEIVNLSCDMLEKKSTIEEGRLTEEYVQNLLRVIDLSLDKLAELGDIDAKKAEDQKIIIRNNLGR